MSGARLSRARADFFSKWWARARAQFFCMSASAPFFDERTNALVTCKSIHLPASIASDNFICGWPKMASTPANLPTNFWGRVGSSNTSLSSTLALAASSAIPLELAWTASEFEASSMIGWGDWTCTLAIVGGRSVWSEVWKLKLRYKLISVFQELCKACSWFTNFASRNINNEIRSNLSTFFCHGSSKGLKSFSFNFVAADIQSHEWNFSTDSTIFWQVSVNFCSLKRNIFYSFSG